MTDGVRRLPTSALDICALAMIEASDSYGYELVEALEREGLALASERTVYPLLARLERDGLLESYLRESRAGPARKYYRITGAGSEELRQRALWTFGVYDATRRIVTSRVDLPDGRDTG